jgi:hypothetical protein
VKETLEEQELYPHANRYGELEQPEEVLDEHGFVRSRR